MIDNKYFITFLLLISFIPGLWAQSFHFVTYKANNPDEGAEIGIFDVPTCTSTIIGDENFFFFSDISFYTDGNLYVQAPLNIFSSPPNQLWEVVFTPNFYYIQSSAGTNNTFNDDVVAITCDPNGNMYGVGKGLSIFNGVPADPNPYYGDLPFSMRAQGGATYREGKLYISSIENALVEVDINNPANSNVVFNFPANTPPIHGLATVEIDCDSVITYASGLTSTGSIIYEVDFLNQTLIEVCQIDKFIMGLTSSSECYIPECEIIVDLDSDDSSGAINNDYQTGIVCSLPISITDSDISIFSETDAIDSIKVFINNPLSLEEYLTMPIINNELFVLGLGTSCLTIVNNGNANVDDFEHALANVLYNNDTTPISLSFGTKSIEVIAYSLDVESEPALSNIIIGNSEVYVNYDSTNVSCYGNGEGEIMVESFGGSTPYHYEWNTNQNTETITQLFAGIYQLTVTDNYGCTVTEEIIITQPDDSLSSSIIITGNSTICDSSAQLIGMANGGESPYQYLWNTGANTQEVNGVGAGDYMLTISDHNGCESIAEFQINEGISVTMSEQIFLCEGESILINNELYSSDTSICEVYSLANGCDSTFCYILEFEEIIYSYISEVICFGESFNWNGELLYADTLISSNYTSSNGCDSIVLFTLSVYNYEPINFSTSGSFCHDEIVEISVNQYDNYIWSTGSTTSNIIVSNEGLYNITVTDTNGCVFSDKIEIRNDSLEIVYHLNEPSCFGETNGIIQVDSIIGGTSPYLFSLNEAPLQQSPLFENISSGEYELFVEDLNGCQNKLDITVNTPEELILDIQNFYEVSLGDSLELQLITNVIDPEVYWEPSLFLDCDTCLNVTSNPLSSVVYEITLIDTNGCISKKLVDVNVNQTDDVYIPNAFSPNNDGINDLFTIFSGVSVSQVNYLKVFDRWGNLVYEKNNFLPNSDEIGWDGRFNNEKMLNGVYVYILEIDKIDGSSYTLSGEVTLVR